MSEQLMRESTLHDSQNQSVLNSNDDHAQLADSGENTHISSLEDDLQRKSMNQSKDGVRDSGMESSTSLNNGSSENNSSQNIPNPLTMMPPFPGMMFPNILPKPASANSNESFPNMFPFVKKQRPRGRPPSRKIHSNLEKKPISIAPRTGTHRSAPPMAPMPWGPGNLDSFQQLVKPKETYNSWATTTAQQHGIDASIQTIKNLYQKVENNAAAKQVFLRKLIRDVIPETEYHNLSLIITTLMFSEYADRLVSTSLLRSLLQTFAKQLESTKESVLQSYRDEHPDSLDTETNTTSEETNELVLDQDASQVLDMNPERTNEKDETRIHHTKCLKENESTIPIALRPKDKLYEMLQSAYLTTLRNSSPELYRFLKSICQESSSSNDKQRAKPRPTTNVRDKRILDIVMLFLTEMKGEQYVQELNGEASTTPAEKRKDQARLKRLVELIANKQDILPCREVGCSALCSSEDKRAIHERVHGSGNSSSNVSRRNKMLERKRKAIALNDGKDGNVTFYEDEFDGRTVE